MQYTTITPRYQIHIPVAIRKKIGLTHHGRAKIYTEKRRIVVEPVDPKDGVLSLAGSLKVKNPIPAEKIRDYLDEMWGE